MTLLLCYILTVIALNASPVPNLDPRYVLISQQDLRKSILDTPLKIEKHLIFFERGGFPGLGSTLYVTYKAIYSKKPGNYASHFLFGEAARIYRAEIGRYRPNDGDRQKITRQEQSTINDLWREAKEHLQRAVELNPESGLAQAEYGHFLIWETSDKKEGLERMEKAVRLSPEMPRLHRLLGQVSAYSWLESYNPTRAEKELRKAIQLDSHYAVPHMTLADMYWRQKRYKEAGVEARAFMALTPASEHNGEFLKTILRDAEAPLKK